MHVIVTGASKGIGNALAREFAKLPKIELYLISRSESRLEILAEECRKINPNAKIIVVPFDLMKLEQVELPAELSVPHVDILVNNAGFLVKKPFEELQPAEIKDMIGVNYLAPVFLLQKLLGRMGGNRPTHVVNISSMGGFQGSMKFPGLSLYSSSKAGLASMTECLAEEYKGKNIFFNCLALGSVQTEMLEEAFPGYKAPLSPVEMAEYMVNFALSGYRYFNGKILPLSVTTP